MERRRVIRLLLIVGGVLAVPAATSLADDARIAATRADLLDPAWIEGALAELGIDRLIKEYDGHADPLVQRVRDALVLSRWFLREHPEELRSQLQARLISSTEPELQVFQELPADRVRARATRATLNQAGDGLVGTYRLSGQGGEFVASSDGEVIAVRASHYDRANGRNTRGIELRNGFSGDIIAMVAESGENRSPLALSPSRRTLIALERQAGTLLAWDLAANQQLWATRIYDDDFPHTVSAAFSPDESKVAVATPGCNAVYETATGNVVSSLAIADDAEVAELAFLGEEQLAGCIRGESLSIWEVATGVAAIEHDMPAVRLSDDGRMALVAEEKPDFSYTTLNSLAVHDTISGNVIREIALDESLITARSFDFDPEGEHVLVAVYRTNGPIIAFEVESGEIAARVPQGMSGSLYMRPITGLRALTSSFDDLIQVWDLNRAQKRRVDDQPGRITCVDQTADGRFGVTNARAEGEVHLWDLESGAAVDEFKLSIPDVSPTYVAQVSISDSADTILASFAYSSGYMYHTGFVYRIDVATGAAEVLLESPFGEDESIRCLRMSGDGITAVAVGKEQTIVFDPATGATLMRTKGGSLADVSADGGIVLVDNLLINRQTGDEIQIDGFNLRNLQMSDDGSRVVDYSSFEGYTVWNLATRTRLPGAAVEWKYDIPRQHRSDCDISADGRFVICGDLDGQLAVFDSQDRKRLATLAIDDSCVINLSISADGSSVFLTTHMGRLHHYRLENLPGSTDAE